MPKEEPKPMGKMTLEELRRIASTLSNSCFVRYWVGWNNHHLYPPEGEPSVMALSAMEGDGSPTGLYERDMERRGFRKEVLDDGDFVVWLVERVDEEGRPWRSPFEDPPPDA